MLSQSILPCQTALKTKPCKHYPIRRSTGDDCLMISEQPDRLYQTQFATEYTDYGLYTQGYDVCGSCNAFLCSFVSLLSLDSSAVFPSLSQSALPAICPGFWGAYSVMIHWNRTDPRFTGCPSSAPYIYMDGEWQLFLLFSSFSIH